MERMSSEVGCGHGSVPLCSQLHLSECAVPGGPLVELCQGAAERRRQGREAERRSEAAECDSPENLSLRALTTAINNFY